MGRRLLDGEAFRTSSNQYDWLGTGTYFWEANPHRGLEFAREAAARKGSEITSPFVVGAVIDLGLCLDLTTKVGIELVRTAYGVLVSTFQAADLSLPENSKDKLRRPLDRAVIEIVHMILDREGEKVDSVRGMFAEGEPAYPGAGFEAKTHVQIAVRNPSCIKGVFRVPEEQLKVWA